MRYKILALSAVLCSLLLAAAFPAAAVDEAVVSVDSATLKATAQPPIILAGKPNWRERDLRIGIINTGYVPIVALVKVSGLKAARYDVYFAEEFKGTYSSGDVDKGLSMPMSGGAAPVKQRKELESLEQPVADAVKLMVPRDKKVWPFWHLYGPVSRWTAALLSSDESARKGRMIITETGYAPRPITGASPTEVEQIQKRFGMLLADISNLRQMVAASDLDPQKKAQHLGYLVPVGLFLRGDTRAVLTIRNDFDQPFTGTLEVVTPKKAFTTDKAQVSLAPGQEQTLTGSIQTGSKVTVVLQGKAGSFDIQRQMTLEPKAEIHPDKL